MPQSIIEKLLKIRQVRINVHFSYTVGIGKSLLKECNFNAGDWIQLQPHKNKLVLQKVNIKDLVKLK